MTETYKNKEWLQDQYWNKGLSLREISKDVKIGKTSVIYWFNKLNIPLRNRSESIKNAIKQGRLKTFRDLTEEQKNHPKGKDHPNWNNIKKEIHPTKMHRFIERRKKKSTICPKCKNNKYRMELSFNHLLGKYTRNPEDYIWLCQSCHTKRDLHEFKIARGFIKKWFQK